MFHLLLVLHQWQLAGGSTPFTWADLRAQAQTGADSGGAAGDEALSRAKSLIGNAWVKFYGDTDPGLAEIVPQQVVQILQHQLSSIKAQYEVNQAMESEAVATFTAIREGAKRHRTHPM